MKFPDGPVIVVSDSRSRTDKRCERERFYSTEYGGGGISSKNNSSALELGEVVHEAITTALIEKQDAGVAAAKAQKRMEESVKENLIGGDEGFDLPFLAFGMVYAFLSRVWPDYAQQYDLVIVEDACTWTGPEGVVWYARPDIMLRRKKDDTLWYLELKTTGLDPERFCRIWGRKCQIHLGPKCVEATTGEAVEGVIVQGLWKGSKYKGASRSKLIGGYCRAAIGAVGKSTWRTDHAAGFQWRSTSEYDGGIAAWIDKLPREILAEYFPCTPPITPDEEYLMRFVRQRTHRELEIQEFREKMDALLESPVVLEGEVDLLLDTYFPQNEEACENELTGVKCWAYEICWNRMVARDPLGSGLFKLRTSPLTKLKEKLNKEGGPQ